MSEFYVTKYALSLGILKREAEKVGKDYKDRPEAKIWISPNDYWAQYLRVGKDCFDNLADALLDANKRRANKIKNLEKQIDALNAMQFDVAEEA